jgi:hypothetical protein
LELAHILARFADRPVELGHGFADVGGDFTHASRENIEIVVAIELQTAEIRQILKFRTQTPCLRGRGGR